MSNRVTVVATKPRMPISADIVSCVSCPWEENLLIEDWERPLYVSGGDAVKAGPTVIVLPGGSWLEIFENDILMLTC